MGFNIPSNRPMIPESQSVMINGGGRKLGYFKRGKKKKEDEEKGTLWEQNDSVELSTSKGEEELIPEEDNEEKSGFGHKLLDKMKKLLD